MELDTVRSARAVPHSVINAIPARKLAVNDLMIVFMVVGINDYSSWFGLVLKQIISLGERFTMHKTMFRMENALVDSWFFICSIRPGYAGLKKHFQ